MNEQAALNSVESILNRCRAAVWYVFIFSFVINLLILISPIFMLQVYDRVLTTHSYDTLMYLTIFSVVAVMCLGFIDYYRSKILHEASMWLDMSLSPKAIQRAPDQLLIGSNLPHNILKDITTLRQFLSGQNFITIIDAPWAILFLIVIFLLSPILGLVALFGIIIQFSLGVLNAWVVQEPQKQSMQHQTQNMFQFNQTLRNAETIQAMGMLNAIVKNWISKNTDMLMLQAEAHTKGARILAISKFFRITLQILILAVGAYLVINYQLTGGGMVAANILLAKAMAPVEQSIAAWMQMIQTKEAYNNLQECFRAPDCRLESIKLPKPKGILSIEKLCYTPPNALKPTLTDINFNLQPGEILLMIGPSAAGKTTLARLLVGAIKPTAGRVALDGANVYDWNRDDFGEHVGYLPQAIELFPTTIQENISRFKEGQDDKVVKAAQMAGVHNLILKLAEGYQSKISGTGSNLSGGQRQRIALARALFNEPKLLVLDEPNSNLDTEGEMALIAAMKKLREQGSSIIIISHRMNMMEIADKILLLNGGQVQAFGPKGEVLAYLQGKQQVK